MRFFSLCLLGLALSAAQGKSAPELPEATAAHLPRWRGFNLLEKFWLGKDGPFRESDFRMISEWGFNFVRLPMDYRVWIVDGDWLQFNEQVLQEIDQAVAWGGKYGIHVCLNLHRGPGYTVASPAEATNLWRDGEPLWAFANHWQMFARRYRGVPNSRLSFNLINEPTGCTVEQYRRVVALTAAAIRAEDPQRLIICDGLDYGRTPLPELAELKVAQATRGYAPFHLTHYGAEWVGNTSWMPVPSWPRRAASGVLYGPAKAQLAGEMLISGHFASESVLRLRVGVVSDRATVVVTADGVEVFSHEFVCTGGEGEWQEAIYRREWNIYQNRYERDYQAMIPAGTTTIAIYLSDGDWLSLRQIGITAGDEVEQQLELSNEWGRRPGRLSFDHARQNNAFGVETVEDADWLWRNHVAAWKDFRDTGVGVMVGEWGAYNKTAHAVVLRWAEDCLRNWQKAGFGWALWNLRGPFGILDSGRADIDYELFEGHQLDRQFLELLLKY